eukprot:15445727-Alexandrium_andersonii.AAC.2
MVQTRLASRHSKGWKRSHTAQGVNHNTRGHIPQKICTPRCASSCARALILPAEQRADEHPEQAGQPLRAQINEGV